jgi:hypothetical protein
MKMRTVTPKRYNHAMDLGFEVRSDSADSPSKEEILEGLLRRIASLVAEPGNGFGEACGIFDTIDNLESDKDEDDE